MKSHSILLLLSMTCSFTNAQDRQRPIYALTLNSKSDVVQKVFEVDDYPYLGSPDISPDGKRLAIDAWREEGKYSQSHIFIIDLGTSEVQDLGPGTIPSWSADGKYLAYSCYNPRGVYIRSADGVANKIIDEKGWGIQWSPDGQKLAYNVGGEIVIYDLLKDKKRSIQPNPEQPYTSIYYNGDWSPDSTKLCFKARRQDGGLEIAIIDISTDNPELTICFKAKGGFGNEFAWHPAGDRIVGIKWGSTKKGEHSQLHEFKPAADVSTTRLKGQPENRSNVGAGWSPDGKTLYFPSRDDSKK